MKLKFGKFEEVENPEVVKSRISEIIEPSKSSKYKSVYVAYPHMLASEYFAPEETSEDTLEVYIFSLPESFEVTRSRSDSFTIDSQSHALTGGQRDNLMPKYLPRGFAYLNDSQGVAYGVHRNNQVWLINDLGHNIGNRDYESSALTAVFSALRDTFLNPISADEKFAMLRKKLADAIINSQKVSYAFINEQRDKFARDTESHQANYMMSLKNFSLYDSLSKGVPELTKEVIFPKLDAMRKYLFVKDVFLDASKSKIGFSTNEIRQGPFNYGAYIVTLGETEPTIIHNPKVSARHPYEFESGRWCLGGFAASYVASMMTGEVEKVALILRNLLTNYSISTRMVPLEGFLNSMMGSESYLKAMDQFLKDEGLSPSEYNITIAQVYGTEYSFVASRKGGSSGEVTKKWSVKV